MADAKRDANRVTTLIGVSSTDLTTPINVAVDPSTNEVLVQSNDILNELEAMNSLAPSKYDYISLSYTGSNLTSVVYKLGGSGGTTISTLTLGYDGSDNLTSVTKS